MSTPGNQPTRTVTTRRTALITGASSGFGSLFAERFAADGFDVVLVARSVEPMETLADRIRSRTAVQVAVLQALVAGVGAFRARILHCHRCGGRDAGAADREGDKKAEGAQCPHALTLRLVGGPREVLAIPCSSLAGNARSVFDAQKRTCAG